MQTKALGKHLRNARIILAIAGLLFSVYLALSTLLSLPVSCPTGQVINCDRVLGSLYAKTFGVPNAYFGVLYFVAVIALAYMNKPALLALLSAAAMGFVAYFVYAEYQLGSICLYCTGAHIAALGIFLITLYELSR